jgi:signal transduction histidine kinase
MSLRTRITLYGIGIVALVLAGISAVWIILIAGSVPQNQDKELAARATAAVDAVQRAPEADLVPRPPLAAVDLAASREIVLLVLDDGGMVLSSTGVVNGRPPQIPADVLARARADGSVAATVAASALGGPVSLRVHARPWQRPDRTGLVVAAQASSRVQTDRAVVVIVLLLAAVGSLVAAAVGIWLVAGRALRPLRQLTATADEVARSGDLSRRLPQQPGPIARGDDVGRLTASFNAMMARLQQAHRWMAEALAAQQRFTADASHELRTPLTTVRSGAGFLRTHAGAAEPDRAAALADIEAEAARMSRLVDDLLTLARADGGQRLRMAPVDLGELAQQVCRQARTLHPGRALHCANLNWAGAPVQVLGDEDALRRLLWILVDNAVAHTTDDGNVWVAVTAGAGGGAALQVSDDGAGIPPHLLERVFDRFFRADSARQRGGAGLGLSIARWIVRAHGGRIVATNNDRGGATFLAELPAHGLASGTGRPPSSNP